MAKISNKMKIKNADGTFEDIQISYIGQNGTTAEGIGTVATAKGQHVQGKYNIEDIEKKYAHIVGNGEENIPSNAHTLDWEGNAWFAGEIKAGETEVVKYYPEVNITWDGNTEGLISIGDYYKVSDYIPTIEQIKEVSEIKYYEQNEDGVINEAYYPIAYCNNFLLNASYGRYEWRIDNVLTANFAFPVRIYPKDNLVGKDPGVYFYKTQSDTSQEIKYTTSITFKGSSEIKLPINLIGHTNSTPGKYGGLSSPTTGYNIPSLFVDEYGVIKSISNNFLGPVSSKEGSALGLVSANQLQENSVKSLVGSIYWMSPSGFYIYNLTGVAIDTLTYQDTTTRETIYNYTPRILDIQAFIYTSSEATEREWVSVPFKASATKKGDFQYSISCTVIPSEEYFSCNQGKNMDGTPIEDMEYMSYAGYKVLYVADPKITAPTGH